MRRRRVAVPSAHDSSVAESGETSIDSGVHDSGMPDAAVMVDAAVMLDAAVMVDAAVTVDAAFMVDAAVMPERNGTTAQECYAGIAPPPADDVLMFGPPSVEIERFASDDDAYQIVRARQRDGRWIGGWTINYRISRLWIDGGSEHGTCITDPGATTYSVTHHNIDDSYTITTSRATYAFHEVFDFASEDMTWTGTLEVRDASGTVLEGPLAIRQLCAGAVTEDSQGEVPCTSDPLGE